MIDTFLRASVKKTSLRQLIALIKYPVAFTSWFFRTTKFDLLFVKWRIPSCTQRCKYPAHITAVLSSHHSDRNASKKYDAFRSVLPSATYLPTHGLRPTETFTWDVASHVRSEKSSQVADATLFDVRCGWHWTHYLCRCGNERKYAKKFPKPCVLGVFRRLDTYPQRT